MMEKYSGRIIHSISGFYYVESGGNVFECRAKGVFRNKKISPLTGDVVDVEINGEKGVITDIKERKNFLRRPPVANIDRLFIISSVERPRPNILNIDKLSALAVYNNIEPVIVFSKCDLSDSSFYKNIYGKTEFPVVLTSTVTGQGIADIAALVADKICAFSGNSGVGKSSIINALIPELSIETNGISEKLGRGKHTTRSVRLYRFGSGFIADTPGFSSFELADDHEKILKDDLASCFPEFLRFTDNCRFSASCAHMNDSGCAVCAAVGDGLIAEERYLSYKQMYEEVKNIKVWN